MDYEPEFEIPEWLAERLNDQSHPDGHPFPHVSEAEAVTKGLEDPGYCIRVGVVETHGGHVAMGQMSSETGRQNDPASVIGPDLLNWWDRDPVVPWILPDHHRDYDRGLNPNGGAVILVADDWELRD